MGRLGLVNDVLSRSTNDAIRVSDTSCQNQGDHLRFSGVNVHKVDDGSGEGSGDAKSSHYEG
jgi:hypothetical protein